ncbi:hypothetical protein D1831_13840 [Lactiplantibacillus garii]|uniref:Uncharacterized protein n=1 Tax=Lactiplantibacillus garii TaxID=2306423 RepID=A0A3R8KYY0_9LACO|nr:hypothetical protein [Lactiplantibacillus garii]RRK09239.1 hypothetical protein D1831_13840 [Lactiplantibacillus garii]
MSALLASNQNYYLIKTDHNQAAAAVLTTAGYQVGLNDNQLQVLVTVNFSLNDLLRTLVKKEIPILDVQHQRGDLEESLLSVLTNENNQQGDLQ